MNLESSLPMSSASLQSTSPLSRDPGAVAEGFEAMFLSMLLEPIESASNAFFGEGQEGKVLAGLFRQQLADQMAVARPLGIADQIEVSLREKESASTEPVTGPVAIQRARESYGRADE